MEKRFHIYILASKSGVLYIGMTNNLVGRIWDHKQKRFPGFTSKYNVTKLVWYEARSTAMSAVAREKEIKAWRRSKKVALIEAMNPHWKDLTPEIS